MVNKCGKCGKISLHWAYIDMAIFALGYFILPHPVLQCCNCNCILTPIDVMPDSSESDVLVVCQTSDIPNRFIYQLPNQQYKLTDSRAGIMYFYRYTHCRCRGWDALQRLNICLRCVVFRISQVSYSIRDEFKSDKGDDVQRVIVRQWPNGQWPVDVSSGPWSDGELARNAVET